MSEVQGIDLLSTVKIRQTATSKGFRTRAGYILTCAAGPNVRTKIDVSFPYKVDVAQGDYCAPAAAHIENRLWVEVAPNTPLQALVAGAALAANVVPADTEVTINAQAAGALTAFLTSEGLIQNDEVYFRLTSVPADPMDFALIKKAKWDQATNKLKAYNNVAFGLTATAGDSVFVTVRFEDGSYIAQGEYVRIGDEILGSSTLPANVTLRFIVENMGITETKLPFNLTYLHS